MTTSKPGELAYQLDQLINNRLMGLGHIEARVRNLCWDNKDLILAAIRSAHAPAGADVVRTAGDLSQQLIDAAERPGVDTYTATKLWHASTMIDRLTASTPSVPGLREATGDDKKKGWRLDPKWLVQLQTEVEKATGYDATLEVIEETILRTRASPPSVPGVERNDDKLLKILQDCVDDPMWADHVEMPKRLLRIVIHRLALIEQPARDDA